MTSAQDFLTEFTKRMVANPLDRLALIAEYGERLLKLEDAVQWTALDAWVRYKAYLAQTTEARQ